MVIKLNSMIVYSMIVYSKKYSKFEIRNSKLGTRNSKPETRNLKLEIKN